MNANAHVQLALDIFRQAVDDQPPAPGPHLVDDMNLLACWAEDLLGPREHERIAEHLAVCPDCRRELADMIAAGMLEPSLPDEPVTPAVTTKSQHRTAWTALLVAASLLVCAGTLFWFSREPSGVSLLAQAEDAYRAGRMEETIDKTEQLLQGQLPVPERLRAVDLMQRAGLTAASDALHAGNVQRVLDLEDRVKQSAGGTGGMLNLRLQAELGATSANAVADRGSLREYGYQANGQPLPTKDGPPDYDRTTERVMDEFAAAVQQYPECVALRLNCGHLLWIHVGAEEAIAQFDAALAAEPDNIEAHLGLGLIDFEAGRFDDALRHFLRLLEIEPDNLDGQINTAVTYERLGKPETAEPYWDSIKQRTPDTELRNWMEQR